MKKLFVAVSLLFAASAYAEDGVKLCPGMYKVLAEDAKMRVLKTTQKKGEHCAMHTHKVLAAYVTKDSEVTYVSPNGTKKNMKYKAGDAFLRPAVEHAHTAVSDTEAVLVEFK